MILRALALMLIVTAAAQAQPQLPPPAGATFQTFVAELWKDAQAKGITRQTFNSAFAGVTPDPRVIATTKRQPEYNKPAAVAFQPARDLQLQQHGADNRGGGLR